MLGAEVLREAGFVLDAGDVGGAEDEDVAALRGEEIVGELVDENEVAVVHVAAEEGLAGLEAGRVQAELVLRDDVKLAEDDVAGGEDRVAAVLAEDAGPREVVELGFLLQAHDDVVLSGDGVDVGAAADGEVEGADEGIRRQGVGGRADHAVKRGLHGAGGDLEGLEEIGADAGGDDDGDEEDLDVFAPTGVVAGWGDLADDLVQLGDAGLHGVRLAVADGLLEGRDAFLDGSHLRGGEEVEPVAEDAAGGLDVMAGLLNIAGREEHGGGSFREMRKN